VDPRLTARYGLSKPAGTHRRPATCAEVDCKYRRLGWQMRIMPDTPLGDRQMFLVNQSGRRFTKTLDEQFNILLTFEAGQDCFGVHTVDLDKPALYLVRQGTQVKQHTRPEHWVEDFSTHLDKIREQ
jgi:hypothetical protein